MATFPVVVLATDSAPSAPLWLTVGNRRGDGGEASQRCGALLGATPPREREGGGGALGQALIDHLDPSEQRWCQAGGKECGGTTQTRCDNLMQRRNVSVSVSVSVSECKCE